MKFFNFRETFLYKLRDKMLGRVFAVSGDASNQLVCKSKPFVRDSSIQIRGKNNILEIDANCFFNRVTLIIRGNNNRIHFGEGVRFNRSGEIWVVGDNCLLDLKGSTGIESAHLAVTEDHSKLVVGSQCLISTDVEIRTGDSHKIYDKASGQRINKAMDVIIGDHVWLGSHVSILKGVKLADHTIVGSRSLVTKSFEEEGCAIAGIPAKVIRRNVEWIN